jgi:hypothetical protein
MVNKIVLYAINAVSPGWSDKPFDVSVLPFSILPNVSVEDVSPLITENTFDWAKSTLKAEDLKTLKSVRYAIVYRYQTQNSFYGDEDVDAEIYITNIAACLRLIRPMRQNALVAQGHTTADGTLDVGHFDHPINLMEVPFVQKLFHLHNEDLDLLHLLIQPYLKAMTGEYWKFRMAMQYHDAGHWEDKFWKPRFTLWVSGVEALFATDDTNHGGRLVTSERVKYFLGADTNIYDQGDIPSYLPQAKFTVSEIIEDIYRLRNYIVHGEQVPAHYRAKGREGVSFTDEINRVDVLFEGLSFILRKSLLRVLRDNLLEEFKDRVSSRKYWKMLSLTRRDLMGEKGVLQVLKDRKTPLTAGDVTLILNNEKTARIKLHTDADITKYLKAGVSKGTIRENANGAYEFI